jgi:hypothetical protein
MVLGQFWKCLKMSLVFLLALIASNGRQKYIACNLSLYFGNSFLNKLVQNLFSRSMLNPPYSNFGTYMIAYLQFVEVIAKQTMVLNFFTSIKAIAI